MGIRFLCPNGHKLHVKSFLAGKRGVCPKCGVGVVIPNEAEPAVSVASGSVAQIPADQSFMIDRTAGTMDTASQSIIIAVANPAPSSQSNEAVPRVVVPEPLQLPPQETALELPAAEEASTTPADRYVARRARNRRNQVYIAIVLLVSVIVLAAVLVFVLQRGSSPPATTDTPASDKSAEADSHSLGSISHLASL
jgi:hypothetical protein